MTINEVISQLYSLSLGGYFNREKFTKGEFSGLIKRMFNTGSTQYIGEIALPDGWWYFRISKHGRQYDYYIPETRDQNATLYTQLIHAGGNKNVQ